MLLAVISVERLKEVARIWTAPSGWVKDTGSLTHLDPVPSSLICYEFRRKGTCKQGNRCRFSHNTSASQGGPSRKSDYKPDGKLKEWKRLLVQGEPPSHPSLHSAQRFFQLGLEMMNGDLGAAQEAIRLLVTEPGLSFIKTISDRQPNMTMSHTSATLWRDAIRPLFKLLTHPRVVDSAVLEQQAASCFNFLFGVDGARIERLCSRVLLVLQSWSDISMRPLSRIDAVETCLGVLSSILDFNTTIIVNTRFAKLVSDFSTVLTQILASQPEEFSHRQATKYLDYIQRRLQVGNDIPLFQAHSGTPVAREQFVLRRDLPGTLSADGPRHDNDHAEIPSIKILPTYEEIVSPRAEYLPTKNPSEWHIQGIRGRLDREFRLIREDTVGQLRDTVRDLLEAIRTPGMRLGQAPGKNSTRTLSYDAPELVGVEFDESCGLELTIRCAQLPALRKADVRARRHWWEQCKRLQAGGLVCVLDATGSILFCVVSDSNMRTIHDNKPHRRDKPNEGGTTTGEKLTLSEDAEFLFVKLQLVNPGTHQISQVLRWYRSLESSPRRYLVEFPGILLASFLHTLTALQQMYNKPDVPFHELLAPTGTTPSQTRLQPPQYARKIGFRYDAKCLTTDGTGLEIAPGSPTSARKLEEKTKLDRTQSIALSESLSRELAMIQGPPGTGKSFTGEQLIKVLLANKNKSQLGPILCVCYTNHALDQLLEHLVDAGIKGIIRIGSRSKSKKLEDLNLRVVASGADRTRSERQALGKLNKELLPQVTRDANDAIGRLTSSQTWRTVEAFLAESYPRHHKELFGEDEEGWTEVKPKPKHTIEQWLRTGASTSTSPNPRDLEILKRAPLGTMSNPERRIIHRHWLKSIRDSIFTDIIRINRDYTRMMDQKQRVRGDVDLRCLQEAQVVGVTTTGLARQLDTLRKLRSKVLVCEEAGEVLEAHILTALLPSVEHAILIGDHLQLRPQIQNYELQSVNPRGERYSLDMSLFERLVQPPSDQSDGTMTTQLPFSVLETQRRMHPSISDLIRKTLYPALKDAPNVSDYPDVVGMRKRLFWMHHESPEAGSANSQDPVGTSHTNDFEVDMTIALARHLVRQGEYCGDDIAVITPYLGQLQKLRRKMQSMFEIRLNDRDQVDVEALERDPGDDTGKEVPPDKSLSWKPAVVKTTLLSTIRVATVDNFQGEEAKVVIVSLVRSNDRQNCGFLRTSNRVNVLLSRAKHGMFIIGNAITYDSVPMWHEVLDMLCKEGNFGTAFELQCPRHPSTPISVSDPDHFGLHSPESGCDLACDQRLLCGHACTGMCHSQQLHDAVKCLEDCPRPMSGGSCHHPCPLRCGDDCPEKCAVRLTGLNITLPCGHKITSARCWETRDLEAVKCQVHVDRTIPGCSHKAQVQCHVDVGNGPYRCTARCGQTWSTCGHTCVRLCYQCRPRKKDKDGAVLVPTDHPMCSAKCGRDYKYCRHTCEEGCHSANGKACPPCKKPCEVRCGHSKCSKQCHEPCAPCAEGTCHSRCPHGGCTMPCAAPCNWVPCSLRCGEMLECGHQCPSVCGERCPPPDYCQECSSESIKSACVDFLEMKEYRDIDLDLEPCIFPDCRHFLTVTSMDGQMDMGSHYMVDENGLPVGMNKASEPFSMGSTEAVRVCPTCRGSLRNIARYGRIVRRAMLDEATKKFVSWSNERYLTLAEQVVCEQERLANLDTPAVTSVAAYHHTTDGSHRASSKASRISQIEYLQMLVQGRDGNSGGRPAKGKSLRYAQAIRLWNMVNSFAGVVRKEEQPFQRVAVGSNVGDEANEFLYDESVAQVKGHLLATILSLKCDIMVFEDFGRLMAGRKVALPVVSGETEEQKGGWDKVFGGRIDFGLYLRECERVISRAEEAKYPKEQAQGHLFAARFCGFAIASATAEAQAARAAGLAATANKPKDGTEAKEKGLVHIEAARAIAKRYPSTVAPPSTLAAEIETIEKFLNGGTFYEAVTAAELRAVYAAMSMEFRGTGHWYTCENGHPFTVGECGMPMEQARCPECGGVVGGLHHQPAAGVTKDVTMEQMARGVGNMRL
ncbi:hypothetical protein QBC37DRAFT_471134 [Rhypophila decipiens]|uniref:NFX1-type zinc finger-containing protein 1 n=1 Tax=Rhypophila decipiens TaxID=261697 RepID=A0AAN6YCE5_9PEZI|nr:hypothetical protein QBC37DRAFT_471134 [Rhypophila decipiens]